MIDVNRSMMHQRTHASTLSTEVLYWNDQTWTRTHSSKWWANL